MDATSQPLNPELAHYAALDARMVDAARGIELLATVSWPAQVQTDFLAARERGSMSFPQIDYPKQQHAGVRAELAAISAETDLTHPLGAYIARTCESWHVATLLLESLGTPEITEHSTLLFGKPGDHLPGDGPSNIEAAQHFIAIADELDRECDGGRVLVVAHDAVIMLIRYVCERMTESTILELARSEPLLNASVTTLFRPSGSGEWLLRGHNDVEHLRDLDAPVTEHAGDTDVFPR